MAKNSLKRKIKYHLLAAFPTIIGLCILIFGFYNLFLEAVINIDDSINLKGEFTIADGKQVAELVKKRSSPIIGTFLIVIGYMTHRFGRMYVKMRFKDSDEENSPRSEKKPDLMIDKKNKR